MSTGIHWVTRLGSGDSGVVWGIERFGNREALKIVRPRDVDAAVVLFEALEIPKTANLGRLATLRSYESVDGVVQLSMPWIDGVSLDTLLQWGWPNGISSSVAIGLAIEMLKTLDTIRNNLGEHWTHGVLRPQHVLLARSGLVFLTDPLLHRLWRRGEPPSLAAMHYVAPEGFERPVPASDIFSIGSMLFELATGGPLYVGRDAVEVEEQARSGDHLQTIEATALDTDLKQVLRQFLTVSVGLRPSLPQGIQLLLQLPTSGPSWSEVANSWVEQAVLKAPEVVSDRVDEIIIPDFDEVSDEAISEVTPLVSSSAREVDEEENLEVTPLAGVSRRQRQTDLTMAVDATDQIQEILYAGVAYEKTMDVQVAARPTERVRRRWMLAIALFIGALLGWWASR